VSVTHSGPPRVGQFFVAKVDQFLMAVDTASVGDASPTATHASRVGLAASTGEANGDGVGPLQPTMSKPPATAPAIRIRITVEGPRGCDGDPRLRRGGVRQ
jgi:hypothetical protein